jgi:hypothetical protein
LLLKILSGQVVLGSTVGLVVPSETFVLCGHRITQRRGRATAVSPNAAKQRRSG